MPRNLILLLVATGYGLCASAACAQPGEMGRQFATYRSERFGFELKYPARVFAPADGPANDSGGIFVSRDGAARLIASAGANATEESLESYRRFVMRETYAGANFDYTPVRRSWFVVSGTKDDRTFYERITFACGGRLIYGWQMIYPTAQKAFYDRVVEAIHRSYRAGRGEDGNCD